MKLGILSKVYRNTGTWGAPVWNEVTRISDLSVKPTWDKGDAGTRASRVKKSAKTMLGLTITGKIQVSDSDTHYQNFWDAAHTDGTMDLLILNGPMTTNGVRGYRAEWQCFDASEDQAMGNVLYMDFELEPAPTDNEPKKVKVTGGAPQYTDITGS